MRTPDSRGKKYYSANRLVQCARGMLAWCGESNDEPDKRVGNGHECGIARLGVSESKRERYLSPSELVELIAALDDEQTPRDLADFVRLALATGARKSNILAMRWADIDLDLKDWHMPMSKSGKGYHVDLTPAALTTLERREKEATSSPFSFSRPTALHQAISAMCVQPWQRFLKRFDLPQDVRLHDLRRTCRSYQASAGVSLQKIGAALGHRSLGSVQIYARLHAEAVAEARQAGEDKMNEMMEQAKTRMKLQARRPARQKLLTAKVARG